jgi:hypothetical protein
MEQARSVGAVGCSVGRNIFQHAQPESITRAISRIFRDGWKAGLAHEELVEEVRGRMKDDRKA